MKASSLTTAVLLEALPGLSNGASSPSLTWQGGPKLYLILGRPFPVS